MSRRRSATRAIRRGQLFVDTGVANYQIFSGVPKLAEFFAHELTHMVLGWVLPSLGTPHVLDEALAIWLGGGRELTWPEIKRELATELRRDSTWTLDAFSKTGRRMPSIG